MIDTVTWPGASGQTYETELYEIGTAFKRNPGIYIFCKRGISAGRWTQIYVGETDDFQRRLRDELEHHQSWECIRRNGGTHVCVRYVSGDRRTRLAVEADLRRGLNPPCNQQ